MLIVDKFVFLLLALAGLCWHYYKQPVIVKLLYFFIARHRAKCATFKIVGLKLAPTR